MADAARLHQEVLTRLQAIKSVTVYDGDVPDNPPADADGKVYPYAVLWASAGRRPEESRSLEADTTDDLTWRARVTVAAGESGWALGAVTKVRRALDGQVLVPFSSPLEEEPASSSDLLVDPDVRPRRLFLPMSFACTTA